MKYEKAEYKIDSITLEGKITLFFGAMNIINSFEVVLTVQEWISLCDEVEFISDIPSKAYKRNYLSEKDE